MEEEYGLGGREMEDESEWREIGTEREGAV